MWNLKYDTYGLIYKTETHTESRLTLARGWWGGAEWEFAASRGKLLHMEWNDKALLHSTGGCIRYPVRSPVEKNIKKDRDFFGGPAAETPHFHCRGTGSIPGQGTKIPHATEQPRKKNVYRYN